MLYNRTFRCISTKGTWIFYLGKFIFATFLEVLYYYKALLQMKDIQET